MIQMEKRKYRLTGIAPLLGSQPASGALREEYIASRAPTEELRKEEAELNCYERDEKGVTVFMRNGRDELCLMGYQIKGFFKEALTALKAQAGVAAPKSKVDTLIFVAPRFIRITRDGAPLREEDEMLERPLRGETMKGPRTTLLSSEMIYDPWEIEMEIALLPNHGSARSKEMSWSAIEAALSYGAYHGMGQWRNAGYGSFRWEEIAHVG